MQFQRAIKRAAKLRIALASPSGGGKSYTALQIATRLAELEGGRVAAVDTEAESLALYADVFDFDTLNLGPPFTPARYVEAINAAAAAGYPALVLDSMSHAWNGAGGALEMVDQAARRFSGNKYAAWGDVTPEHHKMIEAMIRYPGHVIATMRSKTEYVQEELSNGKKNVRKLGMAPVQRDGMEYEFTLVADLDHEHTWMTSKSRVRSLDNAVFNLLTDRDGASVADELYAWLSEGAAPADEFAELVDTTGVEVDEIVAFSRMHPRLPDDPSDWGESDFEEGVRVLRRFGREKFASALQAADRAAAAAAEAAAAGEPVPA